MKSFAIVQRTALKEEDLLAEFVRAVQPPTVPARESSGIEGVAEWGVMRWRERTFDPVDGVSFGPDIQAHASSSDGVLEVRGAIQPSAAYWMFPIITLVVSCSVFVAVRFFGAEFWPAPGELVWLFPVVGAVPLLRAYCQLRQFARRAESFIATLMKNMSNQLPEPTAACGRGLS